MKLKFKFLICMVSFYCVTSQSTDLLEVWNGVGQHDPDVSAALSAKLAGSEKRMQALSLWLPNVNLVASSGKMSASSEVLGANFSAPSPLGNSNGIGFNTSIINGNSSTFTLQARQPIFSQQRVAQKNQLNLSADAADIEWKFTSNELMLRTAQRYFEVVLLTKKLALLKSEYEAIKIETAKAKEKYKLGESPIIDIHESYAKEQELIVQLISTENDLRVSRSLLSEVSKIPTTELELRSPKSDLRSFNYSTIDNWIQRAKLSNPLLNLMRTKFGIAQQEVKSQSVFASSSLDLIAQSAQQKIVGHGDYGAASNKSQQQMFGIQLTVPLYSGGYTYSKEKETIQLENKTKHELDSVELKVIQSVQASWLALSSGLSRINALSASLATANLKLDATKLAQEVGDRTTLDLINSTNAKTTIEINLLQAKIDYLINQLNLFSLVGELDIDKLSLINSQLEM